jgi:hypothetical protein
MREDEISWLSWDAEDVSTLPDMADVLVVCTGVSVVRTGGGCMGGA